MRTHQYSRTPTEFAVDQTPNSLSLPNGSVLCFIFSDIFKLLVCRASTSMSIVRVLVRYYNLPPFLPLRIRNRINLQILCLIIWLNKRRRVNSTQNFSLLFKQDINYHHGQIYFGSFLSFPIIGHRSQRLRSEIFFWKACYLLVDGTLMFVLKNNDPARFDLAWSISFQSI